MPQEQQEAEARSPFAAPQVSLPKGGGAIRGLGEKFQTNPANGTATLTIPVPLSKSRGEFQPALTLSYSSGSGNGTYGLGWSLGLPFISKRTDKGVPRYVPFARRAENVAAARHRSRYLSCCPERKISCRSPRKMRRGHRIRVDERLLRAGLSTAHRRMFSRIESWTRIADGDTHWRTISARQRSHCLRRNALNRALQIRKIRSASSSGSSAAATTIAATPSNTSTRRKATMASTSRARANVMRSRSAEPYLKRVRYGNREPVLLDPSNDSGASQSSAAATRRSAHRMVV